VRKSLVALDTYHIKEYVFATDKLKEIRGASSLLDRLNREEMKNIAARIGKEFIDPIYMNGGSGLFVVYSDKAELFCQNVRQEYGELTGGGASITYAIVDLPESKSDNVRKADLKDELELLRYYLRKNKNSPLDKMLLPSHPFMHPCDACGILYAEKRDRTGDQDPDELDRFYCTSCLKKRVEDSKVKKRIPDVLGLIKRKEDLPDEYLWDRILCHLNKVEYDILPGTKRPNDFNEFRLFSESKEYLGLIYADGNGMGQKLDDLGELPIIQNFAKNVDDAIYEAMSIAIKRHLPILPVDEGAPFFPFDILLIGGDDIVMVTDAAKAMDVALTIANEFHRLTKEKDSEGKGHTLSVGVVLAPVKYPFRLLRKLAESTLKAAKKAGALAREEAKATNKTNIDDTRINFMTVTGSTSQDFDKVYKSLCPEGVKVNGQIETEEADLNATLRPYDPMQLNKLLMLIREGHNKALGRTKLHQLREAVLKMNLSTSVGEGLAMLRNWRDDQRDYVLQQVYALGGLFRVQQGNLEDPRS